jgi:hypothetical protein
MSIRGLIRAAIVGAAVDGVPPSVDGQRWGEVAIKIAGRFIPPRGLEGQDLSQEAYVGFLVGEKSWNPDEGPLAPWCARHGVKEIINALRRASRRRAAVEEISLEEALGLPGGVDPELVVLASEKEAELRERLSSLSPEARSWLAARLRGEPAEGGMPEEVRRLGADLLQEAIRERQADGLLRHPRGA